MFLLRHGQSYFNLHFTPTRIDPGIEDPELTDLGLAQAHAAAALLAEVRLTRIIISPYMRALQTAEPIVKCRQASVDIMHEVRERAAFAAMWAVRRSCWQLGFRIMISNICLRLGGQSPWRHWR